MGGGVSPARAWRRDSALKLARLEICIAELRVEKERLEAEAKLKGRVAADEAEGVLAQARHLEHALLVLDGDAVPPPADASEACSYPGCDKGGPFGFGAGRPGARRACAAHRLAVQDLWRAEEDTRRAAAAEALEPKTEMSGVGGRLI